MMSLRRNSGPKRLKRWIITETNGGLYFFCSLVLLFLFCHLSFLIHFFIFSLVLIRVSFFHFSILMMMASLLLMSLVMCCHLTLTDARSM
ncbi:hypothetical protein Leryth_015260 [Lithospermum erythrorhizon]|nr:hypothetical protein Leryth_015260 [Lithospermum erythrorhizon]